ncbi:MAG: hypothetical protein JWO02_3749, partial [Solirubrobacterales bacterium]|nr:hypothetical protein [Solirubrobacterales bacterium]
ALAIKPRLALEGSFQVEVRPGTPTAPPVRDGALVPLRRTSVPVQLDQVLGTFDRPARAALRAWLHESATGLGSRDAGKTGANGLRESIRQLDNATVAVREASRALQGERRGDLRRSAAGASDFTAQLARDPRALAGIVTDLRRVSGALAAHDAELKAGLGQLDSLLRAAPADLSVIDRALPTTKDFVRDLRPALQRAPASLEATRGFLAQVGAASRAPELPATLRALHPIAAQLPSLERRLIALAPFATDLGDCLHSTVIPALDQVVPDGANTTGDPAWLDFLHLTASLAGASSSFDANGNSVRLGITQSNQTLTGLVPGLGQVVGAGATPQGINPRWLGYGKTSPFRPDAPCTSQKVPDLGARHAPALSFLKSSPRPSLTSRERGIVTRALGSDKQRASLLQELLRGLFPSTKPKRVDPKIAVAKRRPTKAQTPTQAPSKGPGPEGPPALPNSPDHPKLPGLPEILDLLKLPRLSKTTEPTKPPLLGGGR